MLVLLIPCQRYLLCVPWPQHTPSLTAHRPQPIRVVARNLVAGGDHPACSNQLACAETERGEVTWTQDVSEPLQIRIFQGGKVTSRKSRISLARQLHLSRLVKEGGAAGQSSTWNHSVHQPQFCCCPSGPLPTRYPHRGRHRLDISLGFPHFLLGISLSHISCLFLCALQQRGLRVFGVSRLGLVLLVRRHVPECGLGVCTVCTQKAKTKFQF